MADCNKNFKDKNNSYLKNVSLTQNKVDELIKSRNALREKIKTKLKEKDVKNSKFYSQGSYAHKTLIKPLNEDYDIDDGIYMDLSDFEKEPTTETVHNWIVKAAEEHTEMPPKDKEPCIRSIFKAGYHIDLPAYKIEKDEDDLDVYYLAKKKAGWEESDPRAMTNWFKNQIKINSEQLRRLVKYFKAWRDFRNSKTSTKLPSGLTLTILACEEYQSDTRDDLSFLETARSIHSRLKNNDEIWKPYEPTENMRGYLSDPQFKNFLDELENLIAKGDAAIEEDTSKKAAAIWQKVLGDRFPIFNDYYDNDKSSAKKFGSPAIVGTNVRSA